MAVKISALMIAQHVNLVSHFSIRQLRKLDPQVTWVTRSTRKIPPDTSVWVLGNSPKTVLYYVCILDQHALIW